MQYVNIKNKGFTLVETLIGIVLLAIVSLGIYGSFVLALRIVSYNKAKETALTIANHHIEMIRNLSYIDIGVSGGIPFGVLSSTENIVKNNVNFIVETSVLFIDDSFDNVAPNDILNTDYKRVRVKVNWTGSWSGNVVLVTDVSPQGVETTLGGGTFSIQVFDSEGVAVPNANINIENDNVFPVISANYITNENGIIIVPGAPTSTESYKITASKNNYSIDKTYGVDEVANPIRNHSTVTEGGLTEISFSIDELSEMTIRTLTPTVLDSWTDDFDDMSQILTSSNLTVTSTEELIFDYENPGEYYLSGNFQTNTITPALLNQWEQVSWVDSEPLNTDVKYKVMYYDGVNWVPIPDSSLMNNSVGFDDSPVNLTLLDKDIYSEIKINGEFLTTSTTTTPFLSSLTVLWEKNEPIVIGNIPFSLQGSKVIGTDNDEKFVYKYMQDLTTGDYGDRDISNLEWDTYLISISSTTGYDLATSYPAGPFTVLPGTVKTVDLSLVAHADNSLLITVKDQTGMAIPNASVRLYNLGLEYDQTIETGISGQSFFTPLSSASYSLEVIKDGYLTYFDTIDIDGQTNISISLIK